MKFDLELFTQYLSETIVWCSARVDRDDPKNSLRTLFPAPPSDLLGYTSEEFDDLIRTHLHRRSELLKSQGIDTKITLTRLAQGRLLVFEPQFSLFDGAAAAETKGFFDRDNFPAWDAWMYYSQGAFETPTKQSWTEDYLISWVPPEIVDLVNHGILVNPEESIRWLEDTDCSFLPLLKSAGLLN